MRTLIGNLGDMHPLEYGGALVYRCTGKHRGGSDYELDILETGDSDGSPVTRSTVLLEGPGNEWFADKLADVAASVGSTEEQLRSEWASDDPLERAAFYQSIIGYFGVHEFDQYPCTFTASEARAKYRAAFKRGRRRGLHVSI